MLQQHRQLSCRGHNGSLLCVSSTTLGQLQSPAPEIAVDTKWPQDMLRSLYQQSSQIRIALFADVQLRLALSRVSSSRLQSQIAAHVATLAEAMRVSQRQQEGQRDQCAYPLDLLQHLHLRITHFRQRFDPVVVLCDALTQRLDLRQ